MPAFAIAVAETGSRSGFKGLSGKSSGSRSKGVPARDTSRHNFGGLLAWWSGVLLDWCSSGLVFFWTGVLLACWSAGLVGPASRPMALEFSMSLP